MKKRIEWVDIAKGIAILLVCLGHRNIPYWFSKWLYTFHLPLFFFLSGYTTRFESYRNIKDFVHRKLRGLVIPSLTLGLAWILFEFCFCRFYRREPFDFLRYLYYLLIGRKIGSSWFITALLVTEIIAYILFRLPEKWRLIVTAAIGAAGFLMNSQLKEQLIWNANTALIGIIFFESAQFIRKHTAFERVLDRKRYIIISVALLCSVACTAFNGRIDMLYKKFGNILLFLLGAGSGILLIAEISRMLEKTAAVKRIFLYLGKNTLPIIFFHYYPGYMITETLYYKLFGLVYGENALSGNVEGLLHTATILLLLIPVIELFNRFFPWAVGKRQV